MTGGLFSRHDIDQEIEHVGLGQCGCDVGALQCPPLVLLGVDPRSHGEFCNENVTSLGEQDGSFGRNHFDFGVRFHDFFDARQRQRMNLVIVVLIFQRVDCLLPICGQNFAIVAGQTLANLNPRSATESPRHCATGGNKTVHLSKRRGINLGWG